MNREERLELQRAARAKVAERGRQVARFDPLAVYDAECARGIVHTAEWDEKMAKLQREFDDWQQASR